MKILIITILSFLTLTSFSQYTTVKVLDGDPFFTGAFRIASVTDYGAIPDDGLEDSVAFKAAIAANSTVFVPDGVFNVNATLSLNGKTIYGNGRTSIIRIDSLKDLIKLTDSSTVHGLHLKGTVGAGSLPMAVFTAQNGIHVIGNGNNVFDCWFSNLEAGYTGWHGVNIYNNRISNCYATYCTVGFFYVSAFDYNITTGCDAAYCTVGFYEFSSSNNRFVNITASYCIDGFRLVGNGDHGTLASSTMNHNNFNLNLQSVTYAYIISDCNFFAGAVAFGGTDTVKNVTIDNCVFQDATISGNKTLNTVIRGPFFRHDVTITAANVITENVRTDSPSDSPFEPFYPNVTTGTAAPGTTPIRNGDLFIDYTNKAIYFSTGTSSSADWSTVSGGSGWALSGTTTLTDNVVIAVPSSKNLLFTNASNYPGGVMYFGPSGVVTIGDADNAVNQIQFQVDDPNNKINVVLGSAGVFRTNSLADTTNYIPESYTTKAYVDDHIAKIAPGYVSVVDFGADSTGTDGSAFAFLAAVATGKPVYVPPGTYLINGVDSTVILQAGQMLFGAGDASIIKTTTNGSTASLAAAMNLVLLSNGNCTVKDLQFLGNGASTYSFPWTSQNGIWVYSDANKIINCTFKNLKGAGIAGVHPSLSAFYENLVATCRFLSNTCGTFNYAGSEYWNISNSLFDGNDIGINEWGANNSYTGCTVRLNTKGVFASGNGGNTDHFSFTDCRINHSSGTGITIQNIVVGVRFVSCDIFSSTISISESDRVIFNGCAIASNVTATATTAKQTLIIGGYLYSSPTITNSGTSAVITQTSNL